jgi:hypothetical protein
MSVSHGKKGKKKRRKKKEEKGLTLYSSSKQFASISSTHTHTHPSIANFHSFLPSMSWPPMEGDPCKAKRKNYCYKKKEKKKKKKSLGEN